jgi:hypothetical protein
MSVYDDNVLLRDMILVSEAMEEVEESKSLYGKDKWSKRHQDRGVQRPSYSKNDESEARINKIYSDKKKTGVGNGPRSMRQRPAGMAIYNEERERGKSDYAANVKRTSTFGVQSDHGKIMTNRDVINRAYTKTKESFEDIYNSIL